MQNHCHREKDIQDNTLRTKSEPSTIIFFGMQLTIPQSITKLQAHHHQNCMESPTKSAQESHGFLVYPKTKHVNANFLHGVVYGKDRQLSDVAINSVELFGSGWVARFYLSFA